MAARRARLAVLLCGGHQGGGLVDGVHPACWASNSRTFKLFLNSLRFEINLGCMFYRILFTLFLPDSDGFFFLLLLADLVLAFSAFPLLLCFIGLGLVCTTLGLA